jgi:hypothetical protein
VPDEDFVQGWLHHLEVLDPGPRRESAMKEGLRRGAFSEEEAVHPVPVPLGMKHLGALKPIHSGALKAQSHLPPRLASAQLPKGPIQHLARAREKADVVAEAFGLLHPNAKLALIFVPVPVAAKFFIPVLLLLDLFSGVTGFSLFGAGIAHFAHLGGAAIGVLLTLLWRKHSHGDTLLRPAM